MRKAHRRIIEELSKSPRSGYVADVGGRTGQFGFDSEAVVLALWPKASSTFVDNLVDRLPNKFGAFSNYLGGGMRGAITSPSVEAMCSHGATLPQARRLAAFGDACKERFAELEAEADGDEESSAAERVAARSRLPVSAY